MSEPHQELHELESEQPDMTTDTATAASVPAAVQATSEHEEQEENATQEQPARGADQGTTLKQDGGLGTEVDGEGAGTELVSTGPALTSSEPEPEALPAQQLDAHLVSETQECDVEQAQQSHMEPARAATETEGAKGKEAQATAGSSPSQNQKEHISGSEGEATAHQELEEDEGETQPTAATAAPEQTEAISEAQLSQEAPSSESAAAPPEQPAEPSETETQNITESLASTSLADEAPVPAPATATATAPELADEETSSAAAPPALTAELEGTTSADVPVFSSEQNPSNQAQTQPGDEHHPAPRREATLPPPPPPAKDAPSSSNATNDASPSDSAPGAGTDPATLAAVASMFGREPSPAARTSTPPSTAGASRDDKALPSFPSTPNTSSSNAQTRSTLSPLLPTTPNAPSTPTTGSTASKPRSPGLPITKGPPPTTQAAEEIPFDFNRFLDQMKHRSAGPVADYVRSFIKGFSKKPYRTADQIKLVFDFLDFISLRMRECEVWATLSEKDFENATEAMEKLVMNRLYSYTFTPAVAREARWAVQTDDLERDHVLKQRVRLFGWIGEQHLDVPRGEHSRGFVEFAMQELLKINHYKAPRDKLICILNCCKVIFGLIRHLSTEENADTFVPVLIYVVLRANPDNLISNVEYISRFRSPERLSSESGYYLSSLMGAIAFIETMDYTSLSNITQEEFERNVEQAVQTLGPEPASPNSANAAFAQRSRPGSANLTPTGTVQGDESAKALPLTPMAATAAASFADDTRAFFQRTGEAAKAGFASGLGKPIGALGRILNEAVEGVRTPGGGSGSSTPPDAVQGAQASKRMFGWPFDSGEDAVPESETAARSYSQGSWSRSMRPDAADEEPQTPGSGDLRQGPFSTLSGAGGGGAAAVPPGAPRASRRGPVPPFLPQRGYSVDPYGPGGYEDDTGSGVGTPTDESPPNSPGSGGGPNVNANVQRRREDWGGFVPSFLSDPAPAPTPTRPRGNQAMGQHTELQRGPVGGPTLRGGDAQAYGEEEEGEEEDLADVSAEIERVSAARASAGLETLRSIFPDTDPEVCEMVLESVGGDVAKAIDSLLEMAGEAGPGGSLGAGAGAGAGVGTGDEGEGPYEVEQARET